MLLSTEQHHTHDGRGGQRGRRHSIVTVIIKVQKGNLGHEQRAQSTKHNTYDGRRAKGEDTPNVAWASRLL